MIGYAAAVAHANRRRGPLAPAGSEPPRPPPTTRLTKAAFIAREIAETRAAGFDADWRDERLVRAGRVYQVVAFESDHPLNCGWVLVHDDPGALAYHRRLFGQEPA